MLDGFKHTDLPDLSLARVHLSTATTACSRILPVAPDIDSAALVAVAAARVLASYAGVSDILLGALSDNQLTSSQLPEQIVPLRVQWSDTTSWRDAVDIVRAAAVDASPRSLADLRRILDLNQRQIPCIAFFHKASHSHPLTGLPEDSARHLTISFDPEQHSLCVLASTRYIHPSAADVFLSTVLTLCEHAAQNPDAKLASLPHLPDDVLSVYEHPTTSERAKVYSHLPRVDIATDYILPHVRDSPDTPAVHWYPALAHDEVADGTNAVSTDEAAGSTAATWAHETLTYGALHRRSNQLARWLLARGLQRDDRVAVCMSRNINFHLAMFGVMRAGGCYVPIDTDLPSERQSYIAKDSDARFVLVSGNRASLELFGSRGIDLEEDAIQQEIKSMSEDDVNEATPDGLAYLLYTSGTTGTPKGCLLTHEGLTEAIWALTFFAADVRLDKLSEGRYLAVASTAFDVHISETLVPLSLGIPLYTAPRTLLLEDLPFYISRLGITHVGIVPSLIEATMGSVEEDESDGEGMKLRYIGSGGEKISDSILDKWADHPKVRLANFYGPSEVTIGCSGRWMAPETTKANIGPPFANVSAYIIDPDTRAVLPLGASGELLVAGPLVGRGYHNRPELTAKSFIDWPRYASAHPGARELRAYRTGDLARMMPDGTLEIAGRIDTQIKLRGVRIEAEGVSAVLREAAKEVEGVSSPGAVDVSTILGVHEAIAGGAPLLVSFVAWDPKVSVTKRRSAERPKVVRDLPRGMLKAMRAASERELAAYMRPAHIVPLTWLPLSSNGKADAKVLASIFKELEIDVLASLGGEEERVSIDEDGEDEEESEKAVDRPLTDIERRVAEVLEKHCTVPGGTTRPNTNFFACGMDSMTLIRFTSGIKKIFRKIISVSEVMQTPTIAGVAALLPDEDSSSMSTTKAETHVACFAAEWTKEVHLSYPDLKIESVLPPFPIQEGVLYRSEGSPEMYVQHVVLTLSESTSVPKLRQAWEDVMRSCEILRTLFIFDKALVQVVLKSEACELPWAERKAPIGEDDDATFVEWYFAEQASHIAEEINSKISSISPFRFNIYTGSPTRAVLAIHHALFDGISLPLLLKRVDDTYLGKVSDKTPAVTLAAVLDAMATVDTDKAKTFWTKSFSGFDWAHLPLRSPSPSSPARRISVPFDTPLSVLNAKLASRQVTLQALLTCTFAGLLGMRLYESRDIVFGVIRSGRLLSIDGIDTALCPTLSVLPARVKLSNSGMLKTVQRDVSAAVEFEQIPLGKVQSWIRPGESVFETLFSVSMKDETNYEIWDIARSELPQLDYVLAVEIIVDQKEDGLIVHAAHSEFDLSAEIVDGLVGDFERVALEIVENGVPRGLEHFKETESAKPKGSSADNVESVAVDEELLESIRTVVARFLAVDPQLLSPATSFVGLGLDSIKSVALSRSLRKEGLDISALDVMKQSSVQKLGQFITLSKVSKGDGPARQEDSLASFQKDCIQIRDHVDLKSIKYSEADGVKLLPTTILQAGMLSRTVSSQGDLYVHEFPLQLSEVVDPDQLRRTWQTAVEQFSILRTSFHFVHDLGIWIQAVHSESPLDWAEDTFRSADDLDSKISDIMASIRLADETDFQMPPVYLRLLLPEQLVSDKTMQSYLVLVMHHALYDGLSVAKLFEDVERIYKNQTPVCTKQFGDVLPHILHQEHLGTSFWVEQLKGFSRNPLYQSKGSEPVGSRSASREIAIEPAVLEKVLNRAAVTPQCLGQAAWAKLLAVYSSSKDIVFGHVVSGRTIEGSEDVIGPMLNSIPCRVRLDKVKSNEDLLRHLQENNIGALPWQHASLRSIQAELGVPNLWDSLFLFQPSPSQANDMKPSLWKFNTVGEFDAKIQYPFNVEFHQRDGGGFTVMVACHSDFMSAQKLEQILQRLEELLKNIIDRPEDDIAKDVPELAVSANKKGNGKANGTNGHVKADSHSDKSREKISPVILETLSSITHIPLEKLDLNRPLAAFGIDSITAIQVASRFRKAGLALGVADIITSVNIHDLVGKIKTPTATNGHANSIVNGHANGYANGHANGDVVKKESFSVPEDEQKEILSRFTEEAAANIESICYATSGMKWLIAAWQRSLGSRFQHVFPYRVAKHVDTEKLSQAWTKLLERHSLLRSTFACAPGKEPRIVTFKSAAMGDRWQQETLDESSGEEAVVEKMEELVAAPIPTDQPQAKALLLESSKDRFLLLRFHHFQYDAWSLQLLADDLSRIYQGLKPSSSTNLEAFHAAFLPNSERLEEQRSYWRSVFTIPPDDVHFPALNAKHSARPGERTLCTVKAAITHASLYEERARASHLSLENVFLACWARIQASYSSTDSATFGLWHGGRSGPVDDIDKLAVPCMNVLPLKVSVKNDCLNEVARQVQEDLRSRTPVIEQSDLERIDSWVEGKGQALCNVFVNIIKIAAEVEKEQDKVLETFEVPYYIPDVPKVENTVIDHLAITNLVQDDLLVDIATIKEDDTVMMSIECASNVMDTSQAQELIKAWASEVKGFWQENGHLL